MPVDRGVSGSRSRKLAWGLEDSGLQIRAMKALARGMTLHREMRDCNRTGCTKCPHGPYLYAKYVDPSDGKHRSLYLGRIS